jgi:hypothetical protein
MVTIQSVGVGITLCLEHDLAEFFGGKLLILSLLKELVFEDEAAGDVHDDLERVLERGFDDSELFQTVGVGQRGLPDDGLTEGAGGLG